MYLLSGNYNRLFSEQIVPRQFAQHLRKNIPGAKLFLYEDKRHLFILDKDYHEVLFRLAKQALAKFATK